MTEIYKGESENPEQEPIDSIITLLAQPFAEENEQLQCHIENYLASSDSAQIEPLPEYPQIELAMRACGSVDVTKLNEDEYELYKDLHSFESNPMNLMKIDPVVYFKTRFLFNLYIQLGNIECNSDFFKNALEELKREFIQQLIEFYIVDGENVPYALLEYLNDEDKKFMQELKNFLNPLEFEENDNRTDFFEWQTDLVLLVDEILAQGFEDAIIPMLLSRRVHKIKFIPIST